MTGIAHGFYVWGLAGAAVLGLAFELFLVVSLLACVLCRRRVRQAIARRRFTREARELAVTRLLARQRLGRLRGPGGVEFDGVSDEVVERVRVRIVREQQLRARQS